MTVFSDSQKTVTGLLLLPVMVTIMMVLGVNTARSENIDPDLDGSQFAYGENVGWLNLEPMGDGGSGVQVDDLELSGWIWGENIGWVSLSCTNNASCGFTDYGVTNDGCGTLSGHAWGENVGWINFAPSASGVVIDPITGDFGGRSWGENIGWITFASTGANPYKAKTSWVRAVPSGSVTLSIDKSGPDTLLSWASLSDATEYDVVRGSLEFLHSSGGDYTASMQQCEANDHTSLSLTVTGTPVSGDGYWYLVRGDNCGGSGTFDSGGSAQSGIRDAEITASGNDCP